MIKLCFGPAFVLLIVYLLSGNDSMAHFVWLYFSKRDKNRCKLYICIFLCRVIKLYKVSFAIVFCLEMFWQVAYVLPKLPFKLSQLSEEQFTENSKSRCLIINFNFHCYRLPIAFHTQNTVQINKKKHHTSQINSFISIIFFIT